MSVAHIITWFIGNLTKLKACSPLALFHCACIKQVYNQYPQTLVTNEYFVQKVSALTLSQAFALNNQLVALLAWLMMCKEQRENNCVYHLH